MLLIKTARRLQWLENGLPKRWRLPARYHAQSLLGALEPEISLLPALLRGKAGQAALDVGANKGIYTFVLSRLGLCVHAFEPQPSCADIIQSWSRGEPAVTVHNMGVGARNGELMLHLPLVNGRPVHTRASFKPFAGKQVEFMVPVVSLDSLALEPVAFAKIDVEGFELPVLQGAQAMLRKETPTLLIEIDRERHTKASFDELIDLLTSLRYRTYICREGRLVNCDGVAWNVPSRHYNFIFLPANERQP